MCNLSKSLTEQFKFQPTNFEPQFSIKKSIKI